MKNLDEILLAAKPGDTINLGPHTYRTRGFRHDGAPDQVALPIGCKLLGTSDTLILCQPTKDSNTTPLHCFGSNTVKHLKIDSLLPAGWRCKMDGLRIERPAVKDGSLMPSDPNRVEFVNVSGIFGNRSERREAFGIAVGGTSHVHHCTVGDVRGDYSTLFLAFGGGGKFMCCGAHAHETGNSFAALFGMVDASQVSFDHCRGYGGSAAIYTDTGDVLGATITGSVFRNVRRGLHLNAQSKAGAFARRIIQNVSMLGCAFELSTQHETAEGVLIDNTWIDWSNDLFPDSDQLNLVDDVRVQECSFDLIEGSDYGDEKASLPAKLYAINAASQYAGTAEKYGIRRVCMERNTYSRHPWKSRLKGERGDVCAVAPVTWVVQ